MINKLLITGFVIVVVFSVSRWRTRRAEIPVVRTVPKVPAAKPLPRWVRPAAYAFALAVVASSVSWYYSAWRDDQRIVIVRVINASSGDTVQYQVRKGSIEGRSFETTDGFIVRVADAERIEVQRLD
jgi:hypothetical protein